MILKVSEEGIELVEEWVKSMLKNGPPLLADDGPFFYRQVWEHALLHNLVPEGMPELAGLFLIAAVHKAKLQALNESASMN